MGNNNSAAENLHRQRAERFQRELEEERRRNQLLKDKHQREREEEKHRRQQEEESHQRQLQTERRWHLAKLNEEKKKSEELKKQTEKLEKKLDDKKDAYKQQNEERNLYQQQEADFQRQQESKRLEQLLVGRSQQEKERDEHLPQQQELSLPGQKGLDLPKQQLGLTRQQVLGLHRQQEISLNKAITGQQHFHQQQEGRNLYPSLVDLHPGQEVKYPAQQRQQETKSFPQSTVERQACQQKEEKYLYQKQQEKSEHQSIVEASPQQEKMHLHQQQAHSGHQSTVNKNQHKQKEKRLQTGLRARRNPEKFKKHAPRSQKKLEELEEQVQSLHLDRKHQFVLMPVKSRQLSHAVLKDSLTTKWSPMPPKKSFIKVEIPEDDDEFRSVSDWFNSTAQRGFKIIQIERIQNPYLLGCYMLKSLELLNATGGVSERLLFRGTKLKNIDNICEDNFDWKLANIDDQFARGVSFSSSALTASKYCDEDHIIKVMFLVRVVVSNAIDGDSKIIFSPPNDVVRYDTKQSRNGKFTSKFYDNDFYPQYLIYYKK